jgi:hypothetical protein
MDIKVNGSRLKNLLSYDWVKMLASIIAGIVVWTLLFTTLATRATVGEEFYFVIYDNVSTESYSKSGSYLSKLKKDGVLSRLSIFIIRSSEQIIQRNFKICGNLF